MSYFVNLYLSRQENPFIRKAFISEVEANVFFEKEMERTKFKGREVWGVVLAKHEKILKVAYSLVLPSTISRKKQFKHELEEILENIEHKAFINLKYPSNRDLGFSLDEVERTLMIQETLRQFILEEYTSGNLIDIDKLSELIMSDSLKNELFEFKNSRYTTTLIIHTEL